MFEHNPVHRRDGGAKGFLAGFTQSESTALTSLNASDVHNLAFRIGAFIAALMFASRVEFSALRTAALDVARGFVAWDSLPMRAEIDEVMLIGAMRTDLLFNAVAPGIGNAVAAMFATVVAFVIVVGRASAVPLIEKIARRRSYVRRLDCRDRTFRYTCDQFWLRIQGR